MKIFYFAHFDCTTNEGNAAHVRGVVQNLDNQAQQVWLFAPNWEVTPHTPIHFVRVPQWQRPGLYAITFSLASLPLLFWYLLTTHRPDVVYARFFNTLTLLLPVLFLFNTPLVIEINADQTTEHWAVRRHALKRVWWHWVEKVLYSYASGLVAVAPAIVDSIRQRFPDLHTPIEVIENGVDTTEFYPQDALTCRKLLGLNQKGHYVVYAGAFQVWQGLTTLVEAAPAILKIFPDTTFLLVGDSFNNEGRQVLARIAELGLTERFILPGSCPAYLTAQYICAGDVAVAPYNHLAALPHQQANFGAMMKGSPLKLFSYMACGRPVVASNFREAGAFVQAIGAGLAVPPEDSDALAAAILSLLQDPALCNQMGAAGAKVIHAHHSWQAVTERLAVFLSDILSE